MGKRQSFNFDQVNDKYSDQDALGSEPSRQTSGVIIGPLGILLGLLIIIALCFATGLIVYFTHPKHGLSCGDEMQESLPCTANATWQMCWNMSLERNECLPVTPCEASTDENTTPQTTMLLPIIDDVTMTSEVPANATEQPELDLRLPMTFVPSHYNIELKPDIYTDHSDNFSFTGNVEMTLHCEESTNEIYIQYKSLYIDNTTVTVRDEDLSQLLEIHSQEEDPHRNFYILTMSETIQAGTSISVRMEFSGPLKRDMAGVYWSSYPDSTGRTRYMVATQFESTDARKAFPCLDEPHLKATFNVTLWKKPGMVALSNMPNYSSEVVDTWIKESFEKTPIRMSPYLVAFAVADFDFVENTTLGGPNIGQEKYVRIFTRPAFVEAGYADYAAHISAPMFDYLEEYFNQPYSLPKTDQITIPDFGAGAMENWGLITYRESRLLDDERYTSRYDKWRFTRTIAHELLHQWMGNIVTCEWWGDLWLQEGAARYFENKAVQHAQPGWNLTQTYLAYTLYRAFAADQTGNSHPVHNPGVSTNAELDSMFSSITYDKGSTIYRLLEHVIFKDHRQTFIEAMRQFIQNHLFSVANHADLLSVMDEAAASVNLDLNVTEIVSTWIKQMGFPLVTIRLNTDRTGVEVTQSMFLVNPDKPILETYPSEYGYLWDVPFSYITSNSGDPTYAWMYRENISLTLFAPLPDNGWIIGNHHQLGFYRVNYDLDNWEMLINQLRNEYDVIDVIQRAQILEDSLALARAGTIQQVLALRTTEYLANDTEWLPWYAASSALRYTDVVMATMPQYVAWQSYMRQLVENNYNMFGWVSQADFTDAFQQDLTMQLACKYGNTDCISRSVEVFAQWRAEPDDLTIVQTDFRRCVYCSALAHSLNSEDWFFLFDQYMQVDHELERAIMRDTLACTRDASLLQLYFDMAATGDERIYYTDTTSAMRAIARNYPTGYTVAYDYIDQHWDYMSSSKFSVLADITARYSTEYDLEKLKLFIERHPPMSESDLMRYVDMGYVVEANIRWRHANEDEITQWLEDVLPAQTIVAPRPLFFYSN